MEILKGENHPVLRKVARKVNKIDETIRKLSEDMIETVKSAGGVGLAAPQVGVSLRVIVVNLEPEPFTLVNPSLVSFSGEDYDMEGCLSLPGLYGTVKRHFRVTVRGLNLKGKKVTVEADGLLSRVLQHEIDHLEGILITDRAEPGSLRYVEEKEEPPVQVLSSLA